MSILRDTGRWYLTSLSDVSDQR